MTAPVGGTLGAKSAMAVISAGLRAIAENLDRLGGSVDETFEAKAQQVVALERLVKVQQERLAALGGVTVAPAPVPVKKTRPGFLRLIRSESGEEG